MGYLFIPLGTRQLHHGTVIDLAKLPNAIYHDEHPGDRYGNSLIIPCEYQPDQPPTKDTQ